MNWLQTSNLAPVCLQKVHVPKEACLLKFLMLYFVGVENYLDIWKQGAIVDGVAKLLWVNRF